MGLYISIGGAPEKRIGSANRWGEFSDFVFEFRDEDLETVKHLIGYGWSKDLPVFLGELHEMLKHDPSEVVEGVIKDLIQMIHEGPHQKNVIFLTDGTPKDNHEVNEDGIPLDMLPPEDDADD